MTPVSVVDTQENMSEKYAKRNTNELGQGKAPPLPCWRGEQRNVRCLQLINELELSDLTKLSDYAMWRLKRAGLGVTLCEDIAQDAVSAVLRGLNSLDTGRHPSEADLETNETFCNYLRGVINSIVEGKSRRYCERISVSIEELAEVELVADFQISPANAVEGMDLREELFRTLERKAPKHLRSTLEAWQKESTWTDKIPLGKGCRRHRAELRRLAARLVKQLCD